MARGEQKWHEEGHEEDEPQRKQRNIIILWAYGIFALFLSVNFMFRAERNE